MEIQNYELFEGLNDILEYVTYSPNTALMSPLERSNEIETRFNQLCNAIAPNTSEAEREMLLNFFPLTVGVNNEFDFMGVPNLHHNVRTIAGLGIQTYRIKNKDPEIHKNGVLDALLANHMQLRYEVDIESEGLDADESAELLSKHAAMANALEALLSLSEDEAEGMMCILEQSVTVQGVEELENFRTKGCVRSFVIYLTRISEQGWYTFPENCNVGISFPKMLRTLLQCQGYIGVMASVEMFNEETRADIRETIEEFIQTIAEDEIDEQGEEFSTRLSNLASVMGIAERGDNESLPEFCLRVLVAVYQEQMQEALKLDDIEASVKIIDILKALDEQLDALGARVLMTPRDVIMNIQIDGESFETFLRTRVTSPVLAVLQHYKIC